MSIYYYEAIKGLLSVKTNIKDFSWSYGTVMPRCTEQEYYNCKIKVDVIEEDFSIPDTLEKMGKYHYFRGYPGGKEVYYYRNFLLGKKLKLKLVDGNSRNPKLYVNKTYFKNIRHRFMNLHSVGYLLTDLASYLLLKEGYAPIHSSGFNFDGETNVIFAPPNTGKTLTSMMACLELGAKYIAEDLAVTDGKNIYSVPWTSTFRYYSNVDKSLTSRMKNRLIKVFPPLELVGKQKVNPITDFVNKENILHQSEIDNLILLERDEFEKTKFEEIDEIHRKLVNLNRYEFNYLRSPLIIAYTFFNPEYSVEEAAYEEKRILKKLICNSKKSFVVADKDATNYLSLILKEVSNGKKVTV